MIDLPLQYIPLLNELLNRASERRQPAEGTFELTSRCNLSCKMCYVRTPAKCINQREKELSSSEWVELAHQCTENGMTFLLLTGGEIFLRKDFFEIYEPMTKMGLIITLFTNGTLVTSSLAERLSAAPPSHMEITLYGATSHTYEKITGVPGSYARCCAGIEFLLDKGIQLKLKTTITRDNFFEFEAMMEMAKNWGVPFSAGWLLSKRTDGGKSDVENCRISALDSVKLEASDLKLFDEWKNIYSVKSNASNSNVFYCQAGKSSFVINPFGEMNACLELSHPSKKPLEIGFEKAWKELVRYVDSAPKISPICLGCDAAIYCPWCPAFSFLENNTLTDPVNYLCEIARTRKGYYEA